MATSTDLDLAFSADPDLADPDLKVAPQLAGADYWQALLGAWLDQLIPELPAESTTSATQFRRPRACTSAAFRNLHPYIESR